MLEQEMIIQSKTANGNVVETKIPFPVALEDTEAFYTKVDNTARSLINLSQNTYVDTILIQRKSVNSELD